MEKLPTFLEPVLIHFTDLEIAQVNDNANRLRTYVVRRVADAIKTELTRPWREVLGSDPE